jgi:hypothetical protein
MDRIGAPALLQPPPGLDLPLMARILRQQRLEQDWYQDAFRYRDDSDVAADAQLYDLCRRPALYDVLFAVIPLREAGVHRVLSPLGRRWRMLRNLPGQSTVGMRTTRCKPAMIALLNEITADVRAVLGRPLRLQVNSILRTEAHQRHLASLGYCAPAFSAHITGTAADIERQWYADHDTAAFQAIQRSLDTLQESEIIHVIDEGAVWHVCLNPRCLAAYEHMAARWLR